MNFKIVSHKVTKAIKDAGFPLWRLQTMSKEQYESGHGYKYSTDKSYFPISPSYLYPDDINTIDLYYCPTYIEVWLWLWREKEIYIDIESSPENIIITQGWDKNFDELLHISSLSRDPEEIIEKAIEYLVNNDLIK